MVMETKDSVVRRAVAACHRFDRLVIERIPATRRSWLTRILVPYTIAGTIGLPWLLAGAAVDQAGRVMVAVIVAALSAGLVKHLAARKRPDHIPLLVRPLRSTSSGPGSQMLESSFVRAVFAAGTGPTPGRAWL